MALNSNRDYYLLDLACANEHCPEKSEHLSFNNMKSNEDIYNEFGFS